MKLGTRQTIKIKSTALYVCAQVRVYDWRCSVIMLLIIIAANYC